MPPLDVADDAAGAEGPTDIGAVAFAMDSAFESRVPQFPIGHHDFPFDDDVDDDAVELLYEFVLVMLIGVDPADISFAVLNKSRSICWMEKHEIQNIDKKKKYSKTKQIHKIEETQIYRKIDRKQNSHLPCSVHLPTLEASMT